MSQRHTTTTLAGNLRAASVAAGDVLIVHSSMKSLGDVNGGPETVIAALQQAVGSSGTILMPTFTGPQPDCIFDMRHTPSRTGLITENFRRSPGVRRSCHPTHSVSAWGTRAEEFIEGHDRTSGLGVDSPFHKAAKAGAKVLMIGCTLTTTSVIHVAEAIVRVPYLGKVLYPGYEQTLTLIDESGQRHLVPPRDVPTDSANFTVVQDAMEQRAMIRHVQIGEAATLLFKASDALDVAIELLRADPAALLCSNERCLVCPAARKLCTS